MIQAVKTAKQKYNAQHDDGEQPGLCRLRKVVGRGDGVRWLQIILLRKFLLSVGVVHVELPETHGDAAARLVATGIEIFGQALCGCNERHRQSARAPCENGP